ncbi:MAG: hypothetical protein AB7U63_09140 [Porticoccaceae bacterium]
MVKFGDHDVTGVKSFYRCLAWVRDGQDLNEEATEKLKRAIHCVSEIVPGQIKSISRFVSSVDPSIGLVNHNDYVQIAMLIEDLALCLIDAKEASVMLEWREPGMAGGGGEK